MENNKLLIGIQFIDDDSKSINLELFVARDITFGQLLDGVKRGIRRLAAKESPNKDKYIQCSKIYDKCYQDPDVAMAKDEKTGKCYFQYIALTSFNENAVKVKRNFDGRFLFYACKEEFCTPICDLGFITSSKLVFDGAKNSYLKGAVDSSNVIEAFNPSKSPKIIFPEYNISTRLLWQFDDTPVDIIPPTDPPQKNKTGLLAMLLPSVLSMVALIAVRFAFMGGGDTATGKSGIAMIALSAMTGITAIVTTFIMWNRQKKEYKENLKAWRNQYQDYINNLIKNIKKRQENDVDKLDELYPDIDSLIRNIDGSVYSLNENIYCRSPYDEDFLTFRIGISDDVDSKFEIKGEKKEVVFSQANFDIVSDNIGNERLNIYLREEVGGNKENLCKLPNYISERYRCLKNAPFLYSLKNKLSVGVVDYEIDGNFIKTKSYSLISKMIFELCYYHSPDDLQFVIFFKNESDLENIEKACAFYKFMPHFRGLFNNKSQFVFDSDSATMVLSSLLSIMTERKSGDLKDISRKPHIVFIIFEEYGLKEHAFAEFIPKPPEEGKTSVDNLGFTFVFATKYKEYLPCYCDDVIYLNDERIKLIPRNNIQERKSIEYTYEVGLNLGRSFRFLSSVYYAKMAQNGKVPSSFGLFQLFPNNGNDIENQIRENWLDKFKGCVTSTLSVPIGKTDTGIAYLDLHEKSDGPHMLVAGTTGSGKTEIIISYILTLCMQFSPQDLNLLLVDMKGGGFTKRIGSLPHVVGSVTDVDGDENGTSANYMLSRFLLAMKAEIKRRKILFNKLHVDSIDAYIKACSDIESYIEKKKFSHGEATEVRKIANESKLSHLFLIVDEFTELKRFSTENADMDFMGEINTIARIGRSLGFHIILISQNIEGAITDEIRVNTNARLCLKVATKQASKDMIGTELAASPDMPGNGRAYLLVGTGSKFEYFQSGYSGIGKEENVPIELIQANKSGSYSIFYRSDRDDKEEIAKNAEAERRGNRQTQLEIMVKAICSVYDSEKARIKKPHRVFMSPLLTKMALDENNEPVDLSK